jgi:hypothetical protein
VRERRLVLEQVHDPDGALVDVGVLDVAGDIVGEDLLGLGGDDLRQPGRQILGVLHVAGLLLGSHLPHGVELRLLALVVGELEAGPHARHAERDVAGQHELLDVGEVGGPLEQACDPVGLGLERGVGRVVTTLQLGLLLGLDLVVAELGGTVVAVAAAAGLAVVAGRVVLGLPARIGVGVQLGVERLDLVVEGLDGVGEAVQQADGVQTALREPTCGIVRRSQVHRRGVLEVALDRRADVPRVVGQVVDEHLQSGCVGAGRVGRLADRRGRGAVVQVCVVLEVVDHR